MMRKIKTLGPSVLLIFGLAACSGSQSMSGDAANRFSDQILPLIQQKFAPLLNQESGVDLSSWMGLMAGSDHGELPSPFFL